MSCEIHLNDIGTVINVTIKDCNSNVLDISSATSKTITFKKPSGSTVTTSANFSTDGTDGIVTYTAASGLFDEVGSWKIQAEVVAPNGKWKSTYESFKVYRNL